MVQLPNGDNKRVSGTENTKTEAEAALSRVSTDAARGQLAVSEKTTLEEYLRAWHEAKKPTQAATYARSHESMMNTHIVPGLGKRRLSSITPRDLDIFYAGLTSKRRYGKARKQVEQKPLGDSMKRLIHNMLHQMFAEAVKHGTLIKNPADVVRPRYTREAAQDSTPKAWTEEEAGRFYQVARQDPRGVVFCFAMAVGMRIGEVLGLRWENVHLEETFARIQIAESLVSVNGKRLRTTPKTARARRSFKVTGDALEILREQPARVRLFQEAQPEKFRPSDAVFTNDRGGPILPDTIYGPMRRLCARAGVPYKGTHVLRHSYVSLMGQAGTPVEVISAHVGHARASFTRDRYRTVFETEREDMVLAFPVQEKES